MAVESERKSFTEFVLESALMRADESLAHRRLFTSSRGLERFVKALDPRPREHPRLKRLLQEPSVFESSEDQRACFYSGSGSARGSAVEDLIEKQFEKPGSDAHRQVAEVFRPGPGSSGRPSTTSMTR